MRQYIIFIFLIANVYLFAQIPEFEMPIYFEDEYGNKDTVVIGVDQNGSSFDLLPLFNEVADNSPFDNEFEVRLQKTWSSDFTKRAITRNLNWCSQSQSNIFETEFPRFLIYSNSNTNITVKYNYQQLSEKFCSGPYFAFVPNDLFLLVTQVTEAPTAFCINEFETDSTIIYWNEFIQANPNTQILENENGNSITVYECLFWPFDNFSVPPKFNKCWHGI